jgi:hypothetical protein
MCVGDAKNYVQKLNGYYICCMQSLHEMCKLNAQWVVPNCPFRFFMSETTHVF